ncbi:hypothetical protein A6E01_20820 (plasmid) [Vibrio breoganii]|uniref:Zinc finger DksA/TraR C4-type domain-containing protein n=1 Tax=Vibrio breoganii TaxID=553239 RepID=A0AAN0Y080_9VIBR|nr:TraR/DksA C4-type zinc finger protein [Vibrio breoganii]ANO35657.1 hypothetical protein A6E01_20820 [Vibrio breoganii]PML12804.1 hypothetical protein BCT84_02660 [Vibrio breoganii]
MSQQQHKLILKDLALEIQVSIGNKEKEFLDITGEVAIEDGDQSCINQRSTQLKSEIARLKKRFTEVGKAVRLCDEGEYGYCQACGDDIEPKRLSVRPESFTCVECAEQQERKDKLFS